MGLGLILKEHAKRISFHGESFPEILRLDTDDGRELWQAFLETQPVKDLKIVYGKNADNYIAILFVNYMLTRTSNPFILGRKYDPKTFSLKVLIAVLKTVNTKLNNFFHKKHLLQFSPSTRSVDVESNFSKFLNAFALPTVSIYQNVVLKRGNMESALSGLKGYLYRDFPEQLKVPDRPLNIDALKNHHNSKWFFVGSVDGISVYIRRMDKEILNLKISFDIPFVLPLGTLNKQSFYNLLVRSLNSFNAGY